ncbi:MAG TPA: hydrogenase expression/formation protein [Desulfobacteraceae bacterium]|nr:hydrogenase expression/formation protein [Desulfobacteraceae bacterium]
MTDLKTGKINSELLGRLLDRYTRLGNRVAIGAGIGEDAAAIEMGEGYLLAKTDPITHVTDRIGYYAVHINANDIAAMGGTPRWFLATVLMPQGSALEDLEKIFAQVSTTCKDLGVSYCGGHTEITTAVRNPVVIGQMLGEAPKGGLKPTSGAREGDSIIMTKCAGIEATAIIALELESELRKTFSGKLLDRAKNYLTNPGISVVKDARVLGGMSAVHALHDPTEGGIATGIFEIAEASGLGVTVNADSIPISEETRLLCEYLDVNPLGTFASGSLLAAVDRREVEEALRRLNEAGIPAFTVGATGPPGGGKWLNLGRECIPLPVFHQDELSRIFG